MKTIRTVFTVTLLASTFTVVQLAAPQCEMNLNLCRPGTKGASNTKSYIDDHIAEPHEFPWMVLLTTYPKVEDSVETQFCGGILIDTDLVLLAAHCLYSTDPYEEVMACHEDYVTAGEHDRCYCSEETQYVYTQRDFIHPNYKRNDTAGLNNIALLHLEKNLTVDNGIVEPLNLTEAFEIPDDGDHILTLVGWGSTKDGSVLGSVELLKSTVIEVDSSVCSELVSGFDEKLQICAVVNDTVCVADSGGPLLITKGNTTTLYGILSSGFYKEGECQGVPGIYTRVSAFSDILNKAKPEEYRKTEDNGFEPCRSCHLQTSLYLCISLVGASILRSHIYSAYYSP